MNTYFICATQYTNLGDLMINKLLIEELCKYGKVYVDASSVPSSFKKPLFENPNSIDVFREYGFTVKALSPKALFRYVGLVHRENVSLITRSPGPLVEPSEKVRLGFVLINYLSKLLKGHVVYFGNCCSEAMSQLRPLKSTYMDAIYVRSLEAVNYAKQFLKCPVKYIPDMAFLMTTSLFSEKSKTVIVDYRTLSDFNEESITDLKQIIKDFLKNGYKVEIFYQVATDKEEAYSIYEQLKSDGVTLRRELLWFKDFKDYYYDKAFIISNRLHSLLFGAAYGVIPIARITKDSKVQKIKHVFEDTLPSVFCDNMFLTKQFDTMSFIKNEEYYRILLNQSMASNKVKCSDIIKDVCCSIGVR